MTLSSSDALKLLLDQVDYTKGACGFSSMVGAALPVEVIDKCRAALAEEEFLKSLKLGSIFTFQVREDNTLWLHYLNGAICLNDVANHVPALHSAITDYLTVSAIKPGRAEFKKFKNDD